jgi:hypothetical protein
MHRLANQYQPQQLQQQQQMAGQLRQPRRSTVALVVQMLHLLTPALVTMVQILLKLVTLIQILLHLVILIQILLHLVTLVQI